MTTTDTRIPAAPAAGAPARGDAAGPLHRPRRLRRTAAIRGLVRETRLSADMLVYPLFVCEGAGVRREVPSMPGVFQLSVDEAVDEAAAARADGVRAVLLFGLPAGKDERGTAAADPAAPVQTAVRAMRGRLDDVAVITDVCLCEYTSHGHCGILDGETILNDVTVDRLVETAVSHAEAGAHVVAPSDMMDGRIGAIRAGLDARGFEDVTIMSYAAKYCSAFYGPFRDAAGSAPAFGDRRTHQMDPANTDEALREVALDLEEGADIVMVKPAMPCLDVIQPREDPLRAADRRLSGQRRVRDGEGGGAARLARRAAGHAGDPDRHPPRGGTSSSPTTPGRRRGRWRAARGSRRVRHGLRAPVALPVPAERRANPGDRRAPARASARRINHDGRMSSRPQRPRNLYAARHAGAGSGAVRLSGTDPPPVPRSFPSVSSNRRLPPRSGSGFGFGPCAFCLTRICHVLSPPNWRDTRSAPCRAGWSGTTNGELLRRAQGSFDVLLSMDRGLQHQQNQSTLRLRIVVIRAPSNRMVHLRPLVQQRIVAARTVARGRLTRCRLSPATFIEPVGRSSAAAPGPVRGSWRAVRSSPLRGVAHAWRRGWRPGQNSRLPPHGRLACRSYGRFAPREGSASGRVSGRGARVRHGLPRRLRR